MTTITIRRLELHRTVESTPTGAEICVTPVLDGRPLDAWSAFLAPGGARERIGWPDEADWDAILHGQWAEAVWEGRTELMRCTCGTPGDDPLLARIEVGDDEVVWTALAHGNKVVEVPEVEFRFTREAYEHALWEFDRWDGSLPE